MSLYDDLGVPRDATPEEIKKAYRAQAAATHPDNQETGDADKFKRINHANLVLSDARRRAEYDRTGSDNTQSPEDREIAKALEYLSKMLAHIFSMAEFDPAIHSPLKAMRKIAKQERKELEQKLAGEQLVLAKLRKAVKRLRKRGKEAKADRLSGVIAALEQQYLFNEEKIGERLRVCDRAVAMLSDYDYETEKPKQAEKPASVVAAEVLADMLSNPKTAEFFKKYQQGGRG